MKPGDMIEWVYHNNDMPVKKNQLAWSSSMNCYVPIGEPSLLVSITDETYVWMNSMGMFRMHVDDDISGGDHLNPRLIVPRVISSSTV